jgi:hypothetical protein
LVLREALEDLNLGEDLNFFVLCSGISELTANATLECRAFDLGNVTFCKGNNVIVKAPAWVIRHHKLLSNTLELIGK